MAVDVSGIGFFLPIFSFLLVFIVVYAILKKTKVLTESEPVMLIMSFILASFFIMQVNLVDFVQFSSAWFTVGMVGLFFLMMIIAFLPGDASKIFEGKEGSPSKWFGFLVLGLMVLFFIVSAGVVFDTAVNWSVITNIFSKDWFGMIMLLIIAVIVAIKISKKE
jgi:hypothetical protein